MLPHNTALEAAWRSAEPILNESRTAINIEHSVHPRIIRVGQLDAELLDKELASLIQEPLNKALSLINVCYAIIFSYLIHTDTRVRRHSERVSSQS